MKLKNVVQGLIDWDTLDEEEPEFLFPIPLSIPECARADLSILEEKLTFGLIESGRDLVVGVKLRNYFNFVFFDSEAWWFYFGHNHIDGWLSEQFGRCINVRVMFYDEETKRPVGSIEVEGSVDFTHALHSAFERLEREFEPPQYQQSEVGTFEEIIYLNKGKYFPEKDNNEDFLP